EDGIRDRNVTGVQTCALPIFNEVMDIVRDIKQLGITVVIIEHIMQAVMAISDNITVLSFGKKIAEGKPHEIAHNQDVVAVYLGRSEERRVGNESRCLGRWRRA